MITKKDYCDKDLSLALKEAGYIGQGRCYYDLDKEPNKLRHFGIQVLTTRSAEALNFILAVHLYDAQKWLREEKNIIVDVRYGAQYYNVVLNHRITCGRHIVMDKNNRIADFTKYEEALSEGIKETVKILKENEAIHE